jgi:hypothetical protein
VVLAELIGEAGQDSGFLVVHNPGCGDTRYPSRPAGATGKRAASGWNRTRPAATEPGPPEMQ